MVLAGRYPAGLLPDGHLRRETRLAVRRDVRRATLRAPNISYLQIVAGQVGTV
jgi:hypothetical protein